MKTAFPYAHVVMLTLAAIALSPARVHAQNLVQNPGFEDSTDSFNSPGWVLGQNGNSVFFDNPGQAHSGNWGVAFAATTINDADGSALSQTIATTPGMTYVVSFFLANQANGPDNFQAIFDGQTVLSLNNAPAFGYTQYSANITVDQSTQSVLQFVGEQVPSSFLLDDVSVQQEGAPAPTVGGGIASFVLAIAALAFYRLRSGRSARPSAA